MSNEQRETIISVIKSSLEDLDNEGLKNVFTLMQHELRED